MHDRPLRGLCTSLVALALLACGSPEAPPAPVLTPEPPAIVETPEPPEAPPPDETPAVPQVSEEIRPLAPGDVLEMTRGSFEMMHTGISMDVVAYAPNVQEAITRQLRSVMRDALDGFSFDSGDSEFPNSFWGSCDVTLALADLVAYACEVEFTIGRGEGEAVRSTHAYEIAGDAVRVMEMDDLLVEGADLVAVAEPYDADPDGAMSITPTGIAFFGYDGEVAEVPYAQLGTLLNRSSILSRVPGALDHASEETELAEDAAPPETISVLGEPHALPVAVLLGARGSSRWLFPAQAGTLLDVSVPSMPAADAATAARLGGTASVVPWSTPARVTAATLRRATPLRAAPHGRPGSVALPAGTVVFAVLGDLAAGPSRTGGGQWALVVASESASGWVPSGVLDDATPDAITRIDALLAALPAEVRDAARPSAMGIAAGDALVAIAETAPGTTTLGYVPRAFYGQPAAPRLIVSHAGTVADVRVLTTVAHGRTPLLLVAWQLPSAPTTQTWEAYAIPASGTAPAAPVLTTTLALASAPPRERVTIATSITRHGTFYPLVVRGPGRTETLYTWNGSALVTPAPAVAAPTTPAPVAPAAPQ